MASKGRGIMKKAMAGVSIVASVGMVSSLAYTGYSTYADATRIPEVESAYTDDTAEEFPASRFVKEMLSEPAPGTEGELTTVPIATAAMLPERCSQPDMPDAVVYAGSVANKDYSIVVQAYGAGQGHVNFDSYVNDLASECNVQTDGDDGSGMAAWRNGALMTAGDAVVSVSVNDATRRDGMVAWVRDRMKALLSETSCTSTVESSDDSTRSFYYDKDVYTGLKQRERVSTGKEIVHVAVPQSVADNAGNVRAMYASPQTRYAPESPLPDGIPASLPSMPQRPSFAPQPTVPDGNATIEYQVPDTSGPGCGWEWSGQGTPSYDEGKLDADHMKTKDDTVSALDASVLSYNGAASSWAFDSLLKTRFITQWNAYVKQVQDIEAKWNDLDAKRNGFKPTWYSYVGSVHDWELRKLQRDKAESDWNAKVKRCVADRQARWAADNAGKDSAGPTDGQRNQWQSECETANPKPSGLASPLEPEPTAPAIPSDITIPGSWQTADEAKAEADSAWKQANEQDDADNNADSGASQTSNGNGGDGNGNGGSNVNAGNGNNANGSIGGGDGKDKEDGGNDDANGNGNGGQNGGSIGSE